MGETAQRNTTGRPKLFYQVNVNDPTERKDMNTVG